MDITKIVKKNTLGFYFILIGTLILLKIFFVEEFKTLYLLGIISILILIHFVLRMIFFKTKDTGIIIALINVVSYIMFFLADLVFIHKNSYFVISKTWPSLGIFTGLSLVIYYFTIKKKSYSILIPAIFITIFSTILLFFTLGFFNISFKMFLLILIPIFIIIMGIYLILDDLFKKHKK